MTGTCAALAVWGRAGAGINGGELAEPSADAALSEISCAKGAETAAGIRCAASNTVVRSARPAVNTAGFALLRTTVLDADETFMAQHAGVHRKGKAPEKPANVAAEGAALGTALGAVLGTRGGEGRGALRGRDSASKADSPRHVWGCAGAGINGGELVGPSASAASSAGAGAKGEGTVAGKRCATNDVAIRAARPAVKTARSALCAGGMWAADEAFMARHFGVLRKGRDETKSISALGRARNSVAAPSAVPAEDAALSAALFMRGEGVGELTWGCAG
eukprot:gene1996-4944_t